MSKSNAKSQTGDNALPFSELYRRYVNQVYYYIYSRVQNTAEAEDICSDTFITALETRHTLRDERRFKPWLFTIARNKVNDYYRKVYRRTGSELTQNLADKISLIDYHDGLDQDRVIALEQMLNALEPIEQDYIRLRLIAELPFADIAQVLRQSENKVKKAYYRLLECLKAQVEENNE
jgi:RNA polymerase sigma-70 factor (ECF subfamily)